METMKSNRMTTNLPSHKRLVLLWRRCLRRFKFLKTDPPPLKVGRLRGLRNDGLAGWLAVKLVFETFV